MSDSQLDSILKELGQFGKFQTINYLLIAIPLTLSAVYTLSYVFTAGDLDYRCKIPECETTSSTHYHPEWIKFAVPFKNKLPSKCTRYQYINSSEIDENVCSSLNFDTNVQVPCSNGHIYDGNEKTIVNEFDILCEENQWKLTLVGTINSIGQFVALPLTGFVSDRYGRKTAFILGTLMCGIFGLIRSFSVNYPMFVSMEFLDPALGSGHYSAGFILGMELVGPQRRALGATLISCAYSIGEVLLGVLAMVFKNWRVLLQVTYIPALFVITYFWMIPESVRWLLTKGRKDEAVEILRNVARINKKEISEESLKKLCSEDESKKEEPITQDYPLISALKNRSLLIRLVNCSFCWLTNTLVYYGLSLNSVSLSGDKFINFIVVCLIEIPGFLMAWGLSEKVGRKWSLSGSLILSGFACIASEFVPEDMPWLVLTLFLIGKFAITISFCVLYVYTAEIFPTNLRHSLLAICSMFGRIGLMIAPQTPLLATYVSSLPLLIMGGCAFLSGVFVLQFPETLNKKLPDTIEEALNISVTESNPQ